ncbi:hypothetical protein N7478_007152 [Penicillium angulare]|uniref:uncharacterized protein n=1 Tax=Penicillium angulare TaxID=116970 RepID=UPI0025403CA7|nr:uncharacterized protein N7478_007152 [Penicillium angulare]KAJ5281780.1 hypothetical protein N7478_007152 [Penicillium angulare]
MYDSNMEEIIYNEVPPKRAPLRSALLVAAHIARAAPTPEIKFNTSTRGTFSQQVSVSQESTFDNGAASLNSGGVDRTIHVFAVDACARGFDLSLEDMNRLTDGQAVQLGRVGAAYRAVDNGGCGVRD